MITCRTAYLIIPLEAMIVTVAGDKIRPPELVRNRTISTSPDKTRSNIVGMGSCGMQIMDDNREEGEKFVLTQQLCCVIGRGCQDRGYIVRRDFHNFQNLLFLHHDHNKENNKCSFITRQRQCRGLAQQAIQG